MTSSSPILQPAAQPKRKRRRLRKVLAILLTAVLVLTAATAGTGYWFLHKSLPVVKGDLDVPGLNAPVTVWRDAHGVPHIEADSDHDLFLAQGYVTAQDRLFQMDLSRRQASGLLSEVVGDKALSRDKFFRTFGLRRAAEASLAEYAPESRQIVDLYAQGVNAFMKEAKEKGTLPPEFRILGYEPKEWTAVDSLTIGKYMSYDLGGHWEAQAFRYWLLQHESEQKALELFPSYPKDAPTIIQSVKQAVGANTLDLGKSFADAVIPNEFNGSNNWVVSGSKTESGKPMLANDPHLSLATPSIWYESHLKSPQTEVSGVIFAGIPGIILGRNGHIAWGVTNVGPDVQDLYIEKRNPQNKNQFEYMGKWEDATILKEEIPVKGQAPVPYEITVTRHGPLLSEFAHDDKPDTALAMKWTAQQPSTELDAILRFAHAKNWDEFKGALEHFQTPAQNFVFAGEDGTIAYRANGLIPIRKKGDSSMPVPGWTDEYEWQGFIPWDKLPTVVNPQEGFIATANNKVIDDSYPYHITNLWGQPYRAQRIRQVLSAKPKLDVGDLKQLQFDDLNLQAEQFLPILMIQMDSPEVAKQLRDIDRDALNAMRTWNHRDDADQSAPLVFNLWMGQMADTIFLPEIDSEIYKLFEGRGQAVDDLIRRAYEGKESPWLKEKGGLAAVTLAAFQKAVDRAKELLGDNVKKWKWGDYHAVDFAHPLGAVTPLNLLFNPASTPMNGSKVTVEAAGFAADGEVNLGGAWRTVVDLGDLSRTYNVVGPGQSGHLLSPFYDDQITDWTSGRYHITSTRPQDYHDPEGKLTLHPAH
jgi:penicillin G amidase